MILGKFQPRFLRERELKALSKNTYLNLRNVFICLLFVAGFFVFANDANAATYYVSVADGNDTNCTGLVETAYVSGSSQPCPWQTISKINSSTFLSGDSILFKKGETWRETLVFPSSGSSYNPITIGAYGTGDLPILNGSDVLTNADFSIHDAPSNTYKIAHTAVVSSANAVWESGVKLASATSIANVISTAGSSYYDNSTHTVYVHSAQVDPDPITNGLIYEAATRGYVIDDNDNGWLIWQDLEVRQGYSDLSAHLITGSDNIVRRMEYYDNSNHHLSFYGARNLGEDIYGENCAGGAFLFYSSAATTGNIFRRLNSIGNKSWTGSAIQSHGGAQGNIVEDSILSQTVNQATQVGAVGISGEGTSIIIRRTKISGNWYYAFKTSTSGGINSEFYDNIIDGMSLRSTAISLLSGATNVKVYNNTYYTNASRVFLSPDTGSSVDMKNNIIYANDFYLGGSLDSLTADYNIYGSRPSIDN